MDNNRATVLPDPANTRIEQQVICDRYLRLVKSIARAYRTSRLPQEDLIQEGLLGLLEAHKRFDPARNNAFSTYAVYWIKKYMLDAIRKDSRESLNALAFNDDLEIPGPVETEPARLQPGLLRQLPAVERDVLRLHLEKGKTLDEIAAELALARETVRQIRQKALRRLRSGRGIRLTQN